MTDTGDALASLLDFVRSLDGINHVPDGCPITTNPGAPDSRLTVGDLRRLVEVLSAPAPGETAAALAIAKHPDMMCGCTLDTGERVVCDDPRLDSHVRRESCSCRNVARAVLALYPRSGPGASALHQE